MNSSNPQIPTYDPQIPADYYLWNEKFVAARLSHFVSNYQPAQLQVWRAICYLLFVICHRAEGAPLVWLKMKCSIAWANPSSSLESVTKLASA